VSGNQRNDCIIIDATYHQPNDQLQFLYGGEGAVSVQQSSEGAIYVQLQLAPFQFVILG
jgi:hypothetical protein